MTKTVQRARKRKINAPLRQVLLLLCSFFLTFLAMGQDLPADSVSCPQRDVTDSFRRRSPKPEEEDAQSLLLIPIIGSNPATGFMLGVGVQYGFKSPGQNTRYSMISGSLQYTTKDQKILLFKNNIYTKNNKIFFTGDWRYLVYSQATYGLGTNAPHGAILDYQFSLSGQETSDDSLAQMLNYNFLRLYQSMSYNIKGGFYAGFGLRFDAYSKIVDQRLDLTPGAELITSHYAYNTNYGYSTTGYDAVTLDVNLISDTRDNMINPYRGHFALLSWSAQLFNKGHNSHFIYAEWRSYHTLSRKNPRHVMAFWAMGNFSPAGEFPYLILPATAYDQRSRSGRGYSQGRFRGNNLVYGEAEYRFPISRCGGVWGGVLFVNATSASNPVTSEDLFQSVKPGYGFGFRVMVDKKTRTNLAIDMGFGDQSSGFYLAATETF